MGLFSLGTRLLAGDRTGSDLARESQRLSAARKKYCNLLASRLTLDQIQEGARRLGMLHRGTIVFDDVEQVQFLMDYCVHDVRPNGQNAVDCYLSEFSAELNEDELALLRAMQVSRYAVTVITSVDRRQTTCGFRDLATGLEGTLADKSISNNTQIGSLAIARLLDFGRYFTSAGAGFATAVPMEATPDLLAAARAGDSTPLVRYIVRQIALANGIDDSAQEVMSFAMSGKRLEEQLLASEPRDSRKTRKRELARRQAGQSSSTRRCPCGSGRMYKNCCGRG